MQHALGFFLFFTAGCLMGWFARDPMATKPFRHDLLAKHLDQTTIAVGYDPDMAYPLISAGIIYPGDDDRPSFYHHVFTVKDKSRYVRISAAIEKVLRQEDLKKD